MTICENRVSVHRVNFLRYWDIGMCVEPSALVTWILDRGRIGINLRMFSAKTSFVQSYLSFSHHGNYWPLLQLARPLYVQLFTRHNSLHYIPMYSGSISIAAWKQLHSRVASTKLVNNDTARLLLLSLCQTHV